MRLILNRSVDGKFKKIRDVLEDYPTIFGNKMAWELISRSPVDTGTYMEGHYVATGYGGVTTSSAGKPRKQPWQTFASDAIRRMASSINGLKNSTQMVFGNTAEHAAEVEDTHGYAVFAGALREYARIAKESEFEAKARNGL